MKRTKRQSLFHNPVGTIANARGCIATMLVVFSGCSAGNVSLRATVATIPLNVSVQDVSLGISRVDCQRGSLSTGVEKMTKNAYCPKAYADLIPGLAQYWEGDRAGDMGKPVAVFTEKAAEAFLSKAPQLAEIRITENAKDGSQGIRVSVFLRRAAELSQRQGYLSMSDIRELAGIAAQVNPKVGHVAFRNVVNRLVVLGAIANVRGNKEKTTVDDTGIDWSGFQLDCDDDNGAS